MRWVTTALAGISLCAASAAAHASFHLMQIEQVIGGVNGDNTAQAVQLRMRSSGQNLVQFGRIVARDATGNNPIVIFDFTSSVPNAAGGTRVLVASSSFVSKTSPTCVPDAVMTNVIPTSYLAAGTLTWEQDGITSALWRLSWGGAAYTGTNLGGVTNDADGNFGPQFGSALPTSGTQALLFRFGASALSTTNANDYAVTVGDATFMNNAGGSFMVVAPPPPDCPGDVNADLSVDLTDLAILLANFGVGSGASEAQGDLDEDEDVDLTDLAILLANFGQHC